MPLMPGQENIGKNIGELKATGKYPQRQAVAIALSEARKTGADIPYPKKKRSAPSKPPAMVASVRD